MIKNPEEFWRAQPAAFSGEFVWEYISECFPRGIELSDIDAHVEIGGLHLFFETKNPGVVPSVGERIKFRSLLDHPQNALIFIEGKTREEVTRIEFYDGLGDPTIVFPAIFTDVQDLVKKWVHHAEWLYEERRRHGLRRPHPEAWRFSFWE